MKILKIFGIVVGLHAVVLVMIFANPGCSSSDSADRPTPADTAPSTPSTGSGQAAPMVTLPGATASPEPAERAAAPDAEANSMAATAGPTPSATVIFAPTRPDTPAAAALESQPVAGVTPAATYVVGKGDSLWSIAKRNHVKVSAIAHANHISASAPLHLGQRLIVPGAPPSGAPAPAEPAASSYSAPARSQGGAAASSGGTYRVRPGDTLGGIARRFHVSQRDLGAANAIADPQAIHPGQVLVIPSKGHVVRSTGSGPSARSTGSGPSARSTGSGPSARSTGSGPSAEPSVAAPAPADSGQDLDAGLKPAVAGQVPAIKLDDSGTQSGQGGQQ